MKSALFQPTTSKAIWSNHSKSPSLLACFHLKRDACLCQHLTKQSPKEKVFWIAFDPALLNAIDRQYKCRCKIHAA